MLKIEKKINNIFSTELPADLIENNETRQVFEAAFSFVNPVKPKNPKLIHVSNELAKSLGISEKETQSKNF